MNWNNPNFVALFAAWGQWAGALGSLLAVGIAIWVSLRSNKESQRQSRQVRYDAARPVLVINDTDLTYNTNDHVYVNHKLNSYDNYSRLYVQADLWRWIDWDAEKQTTNVKNVGTGTAFNITSVMFGPESFIKDSKIIDSSKNIYWRYKINTLSVNDNKQCEYYKSYPLLKGGINGYSILAPSHPMIESSNKEKMYSEPVSVCRVTITYHDIYQRKHASIFDLDVRGNWIMKAILEDIPMDIYDLERIDPSSHISLVKRLKNRLFKKWPTGVTI